MPMTSSGSYMEESHSLGATERPNPTQHGLAFTRRSINAHARSWDEPLPNAKTGGECAARQDGFHTVVRDIGWQFSASTSAAATDRLSRAYHSANATAECGREIAYPKASFVSRTS